jgi:hypothetical protein
MADQKISQLPTITGANMADDDKFVLVDTSGDSTVAVTFSELKNAFDTSTGFVRITGDTMTGDLSFGDNNKAIFGASGDLEVFHDGSNSHIRDAGTGGLIIKGEDSVQIRTTTSNDAMLYLAQGGAVTAYHNGSAKLATTSAGIAVTGTSALGGDTTVTGTLSVNRPTSGYGGVEVGGSSGGYIDLKSPFSDDYDARIIYTAGTNLNLTTVAADEPILLRQGNSTRLSTTATGIDVTGTATMDGLTVDGTATIAGGDSEYLKISHNTRGGDYRLQTSGVTAGNLRLSSAGKALALFGNNNDISFYEDTGVTPKFFWDASAESLGIGTSSPLSDLHLGSGHAVPSASGNMADNGLTISNGAGGRAVQIGVDDANARSYIQSGYVNNASIANHLSFINGANESMRIDSSQNVLVGTTITPATLTGTSTESGIGFDGTSGYGVFVRDGSVSLYANRLTSDGPIQDFRKNGTTVGSIGTIGGDVTIGTGDVRLRFDDGSDQITPRNASDGGRGDAVNLGASATRFKDLYLSGTAYSSHILAGATAQIDTGSNLIKADGDTLALDVYTSTSVDGRDVFAVRSNIGGTETKVGVIEANGDFQSATNSYGSISDQSVKQDIVDANSQMEDVKNIRLRNYRLIDHVTAYGDDAKVHLGVVAQELEAENMDGLVSENADGVKGVRYSVMLLKALGALQETITMVEDLQTENTAIKARLTALEG